MQKFTNKLWLFVVLVAMTLSAFAQTRIVTGRVTDRNGEPLTGASVVIKGDKRGTHVDVNGAYRITIPAQGEVTLVYAFVGMRTQERKVTGNVINVVLEENNKELVELVVETTGYQKVDKRLSTSSIVTLGADKVLEANTATLDNMLMGKVAGLTVMGSNSTPGAATKIRIRGVSTISGNREPLWVVDGIIMDDPVPLSAAEINSLDNVNLIGNAISGLNPSDIQSIDILKDAAATAIYGVRAANGVIVVTTKRGRVGKPRINYSADFTYTQRPNYSQMHLLNSKERVAVSKEAEERSLHYLFEPMSGVGYEGALLDFYERRLTQEQFLERVREIERVNTDWFGILFRNTLSQKHNVSVSGASDVMNYYVSGGVTHTPDVVRGKGVTQYSAMTKMQFTFSPKVTGQINVRASYSDKEYTHSSVSPYQYALQTSRAIPAFLSNGDRAFYARKQGHKQALLYNILNELDHSGNTIQSNMLNATAHLEYKPTADLSFSTTMAVNVANTDQRSWFDAQSYRATDMRLVNYGNPLPSTLPGTPYVDNQAQLPYGGALMSDNTRNLGYTLRGQMIYTLHPNDNHTFTINIGPEMRSSHYEGLRTTQYGYDPERGHTFISIDPAVWKKYNELLRNSPDVVTHRTNNFISVFTNLTYSYQRKYVLTYNMRADGSNRFGQDSRAKFLPIWSVSGRWNLHNESLLEDISWLNTLAIKGSYGLQGNVSDESSPQMIVRYGALEQLSGEYVSRLKRLPNNNLRWEKNESYNGAFELALFDNRFSANVDLYYRKGTDQIISKEVSPTVGVQTMSINAGEIVNRGIDIMLTAVPVQTKDFSWSFNINGSRNYNRITRAGKNDLEARGHEYQRYLNGTVILDGDPIDTFYSYRFAGLSKQGYPTFHGTEYQDGDTKAIMFERIFARSGTRMPLLQGGMGHTLRYKNLSLNLFFSFNWGNMVRLNDLYDNTGQKLPPAHQNMSAEFNDRWRKPGDEAHTNVPVLSDMDLKVNPISLGGTNSSKVDYADNLWQMYNKSNLRVVSANSLRLRSASLTYRLPEEMIKGVRNASVRIEGHNLWLWASKELKGQDPDQPTLGVRSTPPLPSYSLSFNLTF